MLRPCRSLEVFLLLAAGLLLPNVQSAAQSSAKAPTTSAQKSKRAGKKPAPSAEVPQPVPTPPTLEQQPPAPPQVTYRDGQLSINSTNATLAQVLRSVQTQTGATIDVPPGAGSERVVATLGPGRPQSVLASLLDGSKFNYVILGEPGNSGGVQKVILLAKSSSMGADAPATTAQNNFQQPMQPQPAVEPPEDEYPQNEQEVENQNQLPPGMPGTPGAEGLSPDAAQPGNRTPEQMLQELQRMQQQQQQMQQQLNPSNQQPFGQPIVPQQPPQPFPNQPQPQRPE